MYGVFFIIYSKTIKMDIKTIISDISTEKLILLRDDINSIIETRTTNTFHKIKEMDYDLSNRAMNCLSNAGIVYFEDLSKHTKRHISLIRELGRKSMIEIEDAMEKYNINFHSISYTITPNDNVLTKL